MDAILLALFWCHQINIKASAVEIKSNFFTQIILIVSCFFNLLGIPYYLCGLHENDTKCSLFLVWPLKNWNFFSFWSMWVVLFLCLLQWGKEIDDAFHAHKSLCSGPDHKSDGWWNDTRDFLFVNRVKKKQARDMDFYCESFCWSKENQLADKKQRRKDL